MPTSSIVSRIAHESCLDSPKMVPPAPGVGWWRCLDSDFSTRPETFKLGWRDRLRVGATALSDKVVRTNMASMVGALAMPLGFNARALRHTIEDEHIYAPAPDARDPSLFFAPPPEVEMSAAPAGMGHFKPEAGECLDLRFESPYVPVNPRQRARWRRHRRNRVAKGRYWRHFQGPRPTLLAVHGFGAEGYALNQWFFQLPLFYEMGYDVLLVTLPFHGSRQAVISPFSGHGFFAGGVSGIHEALGQAVSDLRIFVDHLMNDRGVERVGVTGISLGGYITALLAAVEPRLHFAVPNVPVASMMDLMLEWPPITLWMRALLKHIGGDLPRARHMLAATCPLSYPAVLPKARLMVIGGVGDRIVPPKHARLLWEHWGRCRMHWFPGSHLLHLDQGEYVREMARFMKQVTFC